MSAPEQQHPGGADLFLANFGMCVALSNAHHKVMETLDQETISLAHQFAVARMAGELAIPELRLCKTMVYVERNALEEHGGLQFNFSRDHGGRSQIVGARVTAYYVGSQFVREAEPFTLREAEEIARMTEGLSNIFDAAEGRIDPDLTSVTGIPRIPIFRAS